MLAQLLGARAPVDEFPLLLALVAPVANLQALLAPDAVGKVGCQFGGSVGGESKARLGQKAG